MPSLTTRRLLFLATLLAIFSAAALAWLASGEVIPSVIRNPVADFVEPGVTVWWFILGGPFRTAPTSPGGIAFAAVANAAFWSLCLLLLAALSVLIRRSLGRLRS